MSEYDGDRSWYDLTVEEEEAKEHRDGSDWNGTANTTFSRSFGVLSPLKEADRALELKEEESIKQEMHDVDENLEENKLFNTDNGKYRTPTKRRLGPRAAQRHHQNTSSPIEREIKMESSEESPVSIRSRLGVRVESPLSAKCRLGKREESPLTGKKKLGPRASSRHRASDNNKRSVAVESPARDTNHVNKKMKVGTPDHVTTFRTPESRRQRSGGKTTPNSDSRIYSKRNLQCSSKGKELFGQSPSRRRGISESSKESEPLKELSEDQIAKREKQVRFGKVTDGYQNYKSIIPKSMRHIRDPATPKKNYPYSKRCWDGLVRSWRRKLHEWDDPTVGLSVRAPYTNNNSDLKKCGLISKTGEVVVYTPPENPATATEFINTEINTSPPNSLNPLPSSLNTLPISLNTLPVKEEKFDYSLYGDLEDDAKSEDSEYTRLVGNATEFPDSDSDTSYRLSQDVDEEEEEEDVLHEDEAMEVTEEHIFSPLRHPVQFSC